MAELRRFRPDASYEKVFDNVTINNLLPERFDTPRQEFLAQCMMKDQGITRDQARAQISMTLPINRLGLPEEFGQACAFLCFAKSGFMTGQNLQLDGGSYSGLVRDWTGVLIANVFEAS